MNTYCSRFRVLTSCLVLLAVFASLTGCGTKSSTYNVSGKIVDSESGAGIAEVNVFANCGAMTTSGTDGSYALTGLSGRVSLVFFKQDWKFATADVTGETSGLTINGTAIKGTPQETYQLSGRVLQSGTDAGIFDVSVYAISCGKSAKTNYNGDFTIYGLSGETELLFFKENWRFFPNPLRVTKGTPEFVIKGSSQHNIIEKVVCGSFHTIVLKSNSTVWAWGSNSKGQLGNGSTISSVNQVQVRSLNNVIAIAAGLHHSLALKKDGTVWAWGYNFFGQLGNGSFTDSTTPVHVGNLSNVIAIAAGQDHSIAVKSDGTVWAWGRNDYRQLGVGSTEDRNSIPVQVSGLSNIIAVAAGEGHSIALKNDDTVWTWGWNNCGQLGLGDGKPNIIGTPTQISSLSNIMAIAAGDNHNLALESDSRIWAWGLNNNGQLGDAGTTNRTSPANVNNASLNYTMAVAAGGEHSIAIRYDGSVWSWGRNDDGQLGNGSTFPQSTPVKVSILSNVIAITAGNGYNMALTDDGCVWGWGANNEGQLGVSGMYQSLVPVLSIF